MPLFKKRHMIIWDYWPRLWDDDNNIATL